MEFDLENPLISLKEHQSDSIPDLFASESDHMPSRNFLLCLKTCDLDVSFRQEAISLILQVKISYLFLGTLFLLVFCCNLVLVGQAQYSCYYDQGVSYLAVNYMDRFISKQDIPVYERIKMHCFWVFLYS